ncbi:hypothetical protein [Prochlorococcus sp. MIT 1300]|uniref:hypothetical protein n=1 Tax=Prochlorococcus sp. MIT 1300 TaxID=3096218 RepID=UPI002A75286A|nr:hypothetical protein [Prochlorococcus sp. MIT 1300]
MWSIEPVVTPRIQRIREEISLQELHLRLARLGFVDSFSNDRCEDISSLKEL